MNSKKQGAIGVARAIVHYAEQGYSVFVPVSDTSRCDIVVTKDSAIYRVEVKTTTLAKGEVNLRTSGGNQSWNRVTKRISSSECDLVFIVNLLTGASKSFASWELEGRRSIVLK